jgi:hypothetical protein
MEPLYVNPDWFEKHWYSPEPVKASWRVPTALVSMVVVMIVGWRGHEHPNNRDGAGGRLRVIRADLMQSAPYSAP